MFLKLYVKAQTLFQGIKEEEGQDLIEYALLAALIALACTAGMNALASGINTAFDTITGKLSTAVS